MAEKKQQVVYVWATALGSHLLPVRGMIIVVSQDKERIVLPWIIAEHYDDGTSQVWNTNAYCYRTADEAKAAVETVLRKAQ